MMDTVASMGVSLLKRAVYEGFQEGSLYKRAMDGGNDDNARQLPKWAPLVLFANLIVFFPVILYIGYTLNHIYPVLAMVEDTKPPAYEPVSLNADTDSLAEDQIPTGDRPIKIDQQPALITSSLRRTNRLLYSTAGWTANFRGFMCAIALSIAMGIAAVVFSAIPFVPGFVGTLLASLVTVQISTTWTHTVIAAPTSKPWFRRLPPLRRTFEATCLPVFIYWAATTIAQVVPVVVASALGMDVWDPKRPMVMPEYHGSSAWKSLIVVLLALFISVFLTIPAHVVLVRVQASLLAPEEDTIIPFDRSFEGAVEPALVGGKGYVSIKDALRTFTRDSWVRLYKLYIKLFLVSLAFYAVMAAVIIPEVILMLAKSEKAKGN